MNKFEYFEKTGKMFKSLTVAKYKSFLPCPFIIKKYRALTKHLNIISTVNIYCKFNSGEKYKDWMR